MRFTITEWLFRGGWVNLTHWCTANEISGRKLLAIYIIIPIIVAQSHVSENVGQFLSIPKLVVELGVATDLKSSIPAVLITLSLSSGWIKLYWFNLVFLILMSRKLSTSPSSLSWKLWWYSSLVIPISFISSTLNEC